MPLSQQQHRRRRPRSKQIISEQSSSHSSLLIGSLILLLTVVDRAAARQFLTPVAVGLRSALASRTSPWQPPGASSSSARMVSLYDDDDDDSEEEFLETSFFKASSEQDLRRIRTVRYAFAPKRVSASSSSELEHMEALAIPCAAVRTATTVAAAAPIDSVSSISSGGGNAMRKLKFWESMVCGAISRSVAQTIMHPANTMKTMLQNSRGGAGGPTYATLLRPESFRRLTQGAGANFLLSVPHGAINFAVLECVRQQLAQAVESTPYLKERSEKFGAGLDFLSSAISTITCSIVSTPQMMITGMYHTSLHYTAYYTWSWQTNASMPSPTGLLSSHFCACLFLACFLSCIVFSCAFF
jgi:hypothetical protein